MTTGQEKATVAGHDAATEQEKQEAIAARDRIRDMYYPARKAVRA